MSYYIGLDLGGTAVKGGIVDEQTRIIGKGQIDTAASGGPDHVLARMADLARSLVQDANLKHDQIGGVGVGTPGPIDPKTQVVLHAPNLGWTNVPLGRRLHEMLGWDTWIVNDANAACYGEFHAGAAKDSTIRDIVMLTLGTGIGGGIVIGGKLFVGLSGNGAELGHHIVQINGRLCGCGQRGCVEQYASATALVREATRCIEAGEKTSLNAPLTTKDIFDAAADGDSLATAIVDEACEFLAVAIVSYVHALDPQMVILGGGMAAAGEPLLSRVRTYFSKHYWKAAPTHAKIELATLGNDAGFIGAASLARDEVQGRITASP